MSTYILSLLLSQVTGSAVGLAPPAPRVTDGRQEIPWCHDPRLVVERFASAPDIVHPIGIDFDARGRLLAIESHTHFRPQNYEGPKHDRVRVLEDTDGDGKVDRVKTFFEGTDFTMDLAVHPDGSVYLATRNEILRLRDSDGDGQADENQRIVFLDTKGNYPHNGLSGLAFDSKGDLYFGMGENLGAGYKLIGSDGTAIADEGEGGNVFWCTADGRKLRRVATGFWNPFGVCVDIFGRVFAVDNDPDASPPCRLVHIVEGGDYGYQFRYGRSGRHPFQCWNGQVPGTLPMVAGTGEAPCELVSYESDGLPAEYRGDLLVAAWADHRVERYVLKEKGASFTAEQKPFIQGGKNFHPAGIAVAPDGSLFVSDWVLSDYQLHGKGAIWHVRMKEAATPARPQDPRQALYSKHRPLREAAARALLAEGEAGRQFLRQQLGDPHYRTRAAALTALIDGADQAVDLATLAERDPLPAVRAMAVRALAARGENATRFLNEKYPAAIRLEATGSWRNNAAESHLLPLLTDKDPFIRNAAVQSLAHFPGLLAGIKLRSLDDPLQRIGVLLAHRASGRPEAVRRLAEFLADPDEEVRFLAIKWIADDKLSEFRPHVAKALTDHTLIVRMYLALSTAQARIDNQAVNEDQMAEFFWGRLADG
ncbi:MAG: PQQ-dependent sugar dehydrogenase, partial [Planctomycetes bacterium]|nr:PQQ-dependent sugar dehydrogenase [Planctomycetota bacterium]